MKKLFGKLTLILIIVVALVSLSAANGTTKIAKYISLSMSPDISPNYKNIIIPPNIAPLNFSIRQAGTKYLVKIYSAREENIEILSRTPKIIIPSRKWRKLLEANRGESLNIDIFVKDSIGKWSKYKTINNTIANENIDSHIAYRLIRPIYNRWSDIGIYQRNLEKFSQRTILNGQSASNSCINCHSFPNNDPEKMLIGIRSEIYGSSTLLAQGNKASGIGTKFGYTSWHPSGKIAVYSLNKVRQFFHNAGKEVRGVVDLNSAICYYDIEKKKVKTIDAFTVKNRLETYPAWSPDGKYLYYSSAPFSWGNKEKIPPENFEKLKYDLMRVSYDINTDKWGQPEIFLSANETGLSILLPRVSPDGRFLLFTMCDHGCFPIYHPDSDLYLMDLKSKKYHKLDINSNTSDSWHSFSSNSRWIAFSSKRLDGLYTRTFFSYIDKDGKVYKPFVMPQKDPEFYDSFLRTYSVPELIKGPIKVSHRTLAKTIYSKNNIEVKVPVTAATPKAKGFDPWTERE